MTTDQLYAAYQTKMQKIADLKYASAVLQWDQETYMPPKGTDMRGQQIATLSEIAHEHFTDEKLGALLQELNGKVDLSEVEKSNVQLSIEDYDRNKKFKPEFVRTMSEAISKSFHAWIAARKKNDFSIFQQPLDTIIQLKKQEADILGYEHHPYNALMNDYDKGLTVNIVDTLFGTLRPQLLNFLNKITDQPEVDNFFLHKYYPKDDQWKFGLQVLHDMHYNLQAGRQDISEHPFTTSFSNNDVRVTTRIDENDFGNMLWSCIHEGGHALYEQGLPAEGYGLPSGEACSLSIHESQSRLWENNVGRGLPFWEHYFPLLKDLFKEQLAGIDIELFYNGINKVQPSLIRTEADEITYHFHVMIRYEIEKMLIEGSITAKDIPNYWNEHYKKYLGISVPSDRKGCLQDIHWSHGSFGYFATYSLGSLYASQLFDTIKKNNEGAEQQIANGDLEFILDWLRKHVHQLGRQFTSEDLCKKATGQILDSNYFIQYVDRKFNNIYKF